MNYLWPFALALLIAVPAIAQFPTDETTTQEPLEIFADGSVEWLSEEQRYVIRENAHVQQGTFHIFADEISANYREAEERQEVTLMEAFGEVVLRTPDAEIRSGYARYNRQDEIITLSRAPIYIDHPDHQMVVYESVEYRIDTGIAHATGGVKIQNGSSELSAQEMWFYFRPNANEQLELTRARAQGNVHIRQPNQHALAQSGIYDVQAQKITLEGNVTIQQGPNLLTGQHAELDLARQNAQLLPGGGADYPVMGLLFFEESPSDVD